MTAQELAHYLNGRTYGNELPKSLEQEAENSGLVVIFGTSDDLLELRGAIFDEISCYGGGDLYLDSTFPYIIQDCMFNPNCQYITKQKKSAKKITALWNLNGYPWSYKTDIPHETFIIYENGEPYCRGIVFRL